MIVGVQIIVAAFLLVMAYLTYHSYKKKEFGVRSMSLWMALWAAALVIVLLPGAFYGLMEALEVERTADFLVIAGFGFLVAVNFYLYKVVKKNEYKLEELVRKQAIQKARKKK